MMTFYVAEKGSLQPIEQEAVAGNIAKVAWVDLLHPTPEEEKYLESLLQIDIPTREEMHEIELSNRLYQENGAYYATASILMGADTVSPEIHAITFVLTNHCLVSVRYCDPRFFNIFKDRMHKGGFTSCQGNAILAGLLEIIIDRIADTLEMIGHYIDGMTRDVFRPNPAATPAPAEQQDFSEILRQIGVKGDLISKARESLISLMRMISFVLHSNFYNSASAEHARIETLQHDIPALSDHASFLSSKLSFLLDATLGLVSIQQNKIIKIFSVAAVIFLPPTLVASIYGMNFAAMPELHWSFGYPMAIVLMIFSAFLPYTFFRRKGWL